MEWPSSLIAELAERRCVVLLGAGASAGATSENGRHPPSWTELLNFLKTRATFSHEESQSIERAISEMRLLDAAELILAKIQLPELRTALRETFLLPGYGPSDIHKHVLDIDPKIVITTNYDTIYDDYCRKGKAVAGYSVKLHTSKDLLDEVRSTARLVIKAHGCVSEPQNIVLSRLQYFKARSEYPSFYSVLSSIFLTSTVLFVGYSLSDPDITLVLENASIAAPCAHPHYALVPKGMADPLKNAMSKAYNIFLVEYENADGGHSEAVAAMKDLSDRVSAYRARFSNAM